MKRPGPRTPVVALAALLFGSSCSLVHERAQEVGPSSLPGGEGMVLYSVGRLTFEAPAGWNARGDPKHVLLVSPANDGRIDAQQVGKSFADDNQCLADAEQALQRGTAQLTNVRRHASTVAGRQAVYQEADQQRWHGWAWAVCDGGEQYRLFFTGLSPVKEDTVRAVRRLSSSATFAAR